ncbi:hypothetical protein AJ78_02577 [Emergomyces pasteurianus Ep9510]|uniref:Uncharacterized protein n=1 Tax=Emergomyces pasteurianus Ep9510 TaxID=1447872 RepID=A0A1J9QAS7_9EURO|nr:hypothetical protein AJ78_02577 [Emergomyces pasteurianus Ep9510]
MQGGEKSFDINFDNLTSYGCGHGYATGSGAGTGGGDGDGIHPQDLGDEQLVIGMKDSKQFMNKIMALTSREPC